ncbi:hypothetical protein [Polaromonas glacialis]|uniref:hypothetical protein n=1 Tax=Polaromonas glacialis TaxID=866564 RepID=UPI0012EB2A36|nr:hypothetical protein [Polaromonas glacialis]
MRGGFKIFSGAHWLDAQIGFDAAWETKGVERILHNLWLLPGRQFAAAHAPDTSLKAV